MLRMTMAALIALPVLGTAPSLAAGNCFAVGQQIAAQRGAQLASAEDVGGGKCKIVLLIPGSNGQRPKREEVIVNG
jgi:ribosomal protein L27